MALPEIRGDAKLITDPRSGIAKTGTAWSNAMVRFVGFRKDGDDWVEDSSFIAALAAFGDEAAQLAEFAKGDGVHVEGRLRSLRLWQPQRGEPRPELEITVRSVTRPERRPRGTRQPDLWDQTAARRPAPSRRIDEEWPRPAVPGGRRDERQQADSTRGGRRGQQPSTAGTTTAPQRQAAGIITNLQDHVARRRAGQVSTGRPA